MMYIKVEQRAKSIGGFIGDEIMIAMGDVSWIYKKVYFWCLEPLFYKN